MKKQPRRRGKKYPRHYKLSRYQRKINQGLLCSQNPKLRTLQTQFHIFQLLASTPSCALLLKIAQIQSYCTSSLFMSSHQPRKARRPCSSTHKISRRTGNRTSLATLFVAGVSWTCLPIENENPANNSCTVFNDVKFQSINLPWR